MAEVLKARPVNVQVKFRGGFVPPRYRLLKQDVSVSLAEKLAETYNLKSSDIIVNQNATANQYLFLRYIIPGEPFRYFDAFIGVDQAEVVFSNPATVPELVTEVGRVWAILVDALQPTIKGITCEATLHCESIGLSPTVFLNDHVLIQSRAPGMQRGFSLTSQAQSVSARLNLEVSGSIEDGLYAAFVYVNTESVRDLASLEKVSNAALSAYRDLQNAAGIQLLEPES
jgi:hypothetical protein